MTDWLPFKSSVVANRQYLLLALLLAMLTHAIMLSLKFSEPDKPPSVNVIEVTMIEIKKPTQQPEHAQLLAADNQISNAPKAAKPRVPKQKLPREEIRVEKPHKIAVKLPEPEPIVERPPVKTKAIAPKIIEKTKVIARKADVAPPPPAEVRPKLSAEDLRLQIAQLGAQIARHEQSESESTQIKSLSNISTHKYVAAQYVSDFVHKVERTGNLNHPEVMSENNFTGRLVMDVGINANGSIYSIVIRKKSGFPALDNSAKKIVRMSAPFPPLPKALLNELKVLVISKSWSFSNESGITAN